MAARGRATLERFWGWLSRQDHRAAGVGRGIVRAPLPYAAFAFHRVSGREIRCIVMSLPVYLAGSSRLDVLHSAREAGGRRGSERHREGRAAKAGLRRMDLGSASHPGRAAGDQPPPYLPA
jgi:hypothetical protein